jgi:AraC-like DNA-binding protein
MQISAKAEFELVPRSKLNSFAVRDFHLPAFQSPWHFHPECELTHILESRGKRFVGDSIEAFAPGDLVLIGSNLPHYWRSDALGRQPDRYAHSLVIQFREDCLSAEFLSVPELLEVRRLLLRARRGIHFSGAARDQAAGLMREMDRQVGIDRVIGLLQVFKCLCESSACRMLSSPGFTAYLDEFASARINKAYQYVFQNFAERLDHEEIARRAGMSSSAFCHYFKRVTGRTLSDFINEVRIGNARKLLMDTDDGIAQIAYGSGFESLSNFNRRFRELTRLSPKDFRRQHAASRPISFIIPAGPRLSGGGRRAGPGASRRPGQSSWPTQCPGSAEVA